MNYLEEEISRYQKNKVNISKQNFGEMTPKRLDYEDNPKLLMHNKLK
jgi:hypothetical protein